MDLLNTMNETIKTSIELMQLFKITLLDLQSFSPKQSIINLFFPKLFQIPKLVSTNKDLFRELAILSSHLILHEPHEQLSHHLPVKVHTHQQLTCRTVCLTNLQTTSRHLNHLLTIKWIWIKSPWNCLPTILIRILNLSKILLQRRQLLPQYHQL